MTLYFLQDYYTGKAIETDPLTLYKSKEGAQKGMNEYLKRKLGTIHNNLITIEEFGGFTATLNGEEISTTLSTF